MTLFNLFYAAIYILGAAIGAYYLFDRFGPIGGIAGILLGLVGINILLHGFRKAIGISYRVWPLRPHCKTDKCKWSDYHFQKQEYGGDIFSCACGDKYVRRGQYFMILEETDNGEPRLLPYMRKAFLKGWVKDDEPAEGHG